MVLVLGYDVFDGQEKVRPVLDVTLVIQLTGLATDWTSLTWQNFLQSA